MRNLLISLFFFPSLGIAQTNETKAPDIKFSKWEIGFNTGMAFTTEKNMIFYDNAYLVGRDNISLYRNYSSSQVGARIEAGYSPMESWFIAPEIVVNKVIRFKYLYIYGGGLVGYKRVTPENDWPYVNVSQGYLAGLQAGVVYHLGKHISLNIELAAKSEQMWTSYTDYYLYGELQQKMTKDFEVYFPAYIGVRYRF